MAPQASYEGIWLGISNRLDQADVDADMLVLTRAHIDVYKF